MVNDTITCSNNEASTHLWPLRFSEWLKLCDVIVARQQQQGQSIYPIEKASNFQCDVAVMIMEIESRLCSKQKHNKMDA